MFTFLGVRGLFFRSEAPGLVFSATYLWGSSAPSAFSACGGAAASHQSLQKSPMTVVYLTFHVNNLMLRVVIGPYRKIDTNHLGTSGKSQ